MIRVIKLHSEDDFGTRDFENFINNTIGKRPFVVIVTAEWCGHCQHFKPEIQKAFKQLKTKRAKSTAATVKKGGAKSNKILDVLDINDVALQHLQQNHKDHLLGRLLASEVQGFPTALAVNSINARNEMKIAHFTGNRKAGEFAEFLGKTASLNN